MNTNANTDTTLVVMDGCHFNKKYGHNPDVMFGRIYNMGFKVLVRASKDLESYWSRVRERRPRMELVIHCTKTKNGVTVPSGVDAGVTADITTAVLSGQYSGETVNHVIAVVAADVYGLALLKLSWYQHRVMVSVLSDDGKNIESLSDYLARRQLTLPYVPSHYDVENTRKALVVVDGWYFSNLFRGKDFNHIWDCVEKRMGLAIVKIIIRVGTDTQNSYWYNVAKFERVQLIRHGMTSEGREFDVDPGVTVDMTIATL